MKILFYLYLGKDLLTTIEAPAHVSIMYVIRKALMQHPVETLPKGKYTPSQWEDIIKSTEVRRDPKTVFSPPSEPGACAVLLSSVSGGPKAHMDSPWEGPPMLARLN
jgi:hypothetical protein